MRRGAGGGVCNSGIPGRDHVPEGSDEEVFRVGGHLQEGHGSGGYCFLIYVNGRVYVGCVDAAAIHKRQVGVKEVQREFTSATGPRGHEGRDASWGKEAGDTVRLLVGE